MSSLHITSKLPQVGTTIFTTMSQLAAQHQAINLSQGFPDYPIDESLLALVEKYNQQGFHQYAPMIGVPALREQIQIMYQNVNKVTYHADDEITIHAGASEAIFNTLAALISFGDEVIIFEPAYDLYAPIVTLFGGIVVPVRLEAPHFSIDWDIVAQHITPKTKALIFNNPNNPTGKVYAKADLEQLARCVADTNCIVIADEVYAHIVFEPDTFTSVSEIESLKGRSVVIASFGKLLHATGWKIGYSLAPSNITAEIRKVHQFNTFCVNHALQLAIADYLKSPQVYLGLASFFQPKRDFVFQEAVKLGLNPVQSAGTYFLIVQPENEQGLSDFELAKQFILNYKVAMIPVNAFYSDNRNTGLLRICFAKKEATLQAAMLQLT